MPVPVSQLTLLNTSNPDTLDDIVTIGELATFVLNVSLPEGTTFNVSFALRTTLAAGIFSIFKVTPVYASNIVFHDYKLAVSSTTFSDDTALVTLSSIVNNPDNVRNDDDNVLLIVECMPLPTTPPGTEARLSTVFTHQFNTTQTLVEAAQMDSVIVMQPNLDIAHDCTPSVADAADELECSVDITPVELLVLFYL